MVHYYKPRGSFIIVSDLLGALGLFETAEGVCAQGPPAMYTQIGN